MLSFAVLVMSAISVVFPNEVSGEMVNAVCWVRWCFHRLFLVEFVVLVSVLFLVVFAVCSCQNRTEQNFINLTTSQATHRKRKRRGKKKAQKNLHNDQSK